MSHCLEHSESATCGEMAGKSTRLIDKRPIFSMLLQTLLMDDQLTIPRLGFFSPPFQIDQQTRGASENVVLMKNGEQKTR